MEKKLLNTLGIRTNQNIPVEELTNPGIDCEKYGLNRTDIKRIGALLQVLHCFAEEKPQEKVIFSDCEKVAETFRTMFLGKKEEELWCLYLTSKLTLIAKRKLTTGGSKATVIDRCLVMRNALELNARGIILIHNHPSDNCRPSQCDIKETENLRTACDVCDIQLFDHVIIGQTQYYSFKDEEISEYNFKS